MKATIMMKPVWPVLFFFLLLSGCLEYTVTTRVQPDGSLERVFTVRGDSSDIFDGSMMVPPDTSWTITTKWEEVMKEDSTMDKQFVYTARKHFADAAMLNNEIHSDSAVVLHVNPFVRIKKRFRWFYTFIQYTETYPAWFPFRSVPYTKYLTSDEMQAMLQEGEDTYVFLPKEDRYTRRDEIDTIPVLSPEDSARAEKKLKDIEIRFTEWQVDNILIDFNEILIDVMDSLGMEAGLKSRYLEIQDTLKGVILTKDPDKLSSEKLVHITTELMQDTALNSIFPDSAGHFKHFDRKLDKEVPFDNYTNHVVMPGLLIATNAETVSGNKASWEFMYFPFYADDYHMTAESRIINKWAIVLTGIIVLVLLTGLVISLVKKRA